MSLTLDDLANTFSISFKKHVLSLVKSRSTRSSNTPRLSLFYHMPLTNLGVLFLGLNQDSPAEPYSFYSLSLDSYSVLSKH